MGKQSRRKREKRSTSIPTVERKLTKKESDQYLQSLVDAGMIKKSLNGGENTYDVTEKGIEAGVFQNGSENIK